MATNGGMTNGGTPTSADACMSIVQSLMHHRTEGESEQFSKRAIESLVKKLKEKRDELDNLITAVTTVGSHSTKCVTIPRTLDGRLQIAGKKCFPHVIYAKIWRWPDLHKNELRRADDCRWAFDLKLDNVCVNPYHYIRDVSLGVDLAALTLHHAQQQGMYHHHHHQQHLHQGGAGAMWGGPPQQQHPDQQWGQEVAGGGYHYGPPEVHGGLMPGHVNMTSTHGHQEQPQQPQQNCVIPYHANGNGSASAGGGWHQHQVVQDEVVPKVEASTSSAEHPGDNHVNNAKEPTPDNTKKSASPIKGTNAGPVSASPAPEFWCSINYFELDVQVGETFKVKSKNRTVKVDGYVRISDETRFCLGALTNVQRKPESERTVKYIGEGVTFHLEGEGDVYMECKLPTDKNAVFVQSYYLDAMQTTKPGATDLVHQIYSRHDRLKVFDLGHFAWHVRKQLAKTASAAASSSSSTPGTAPGSGSEMMVNGGHLAPAISHATAAGGVGIDDLRKFCIIRMSFIKRWGPDCEKRKTMKDTPCWIEVHFHRALQVLDEILQSQRQTEEMKKQQQVQNHQQQQHQLQLQQLHQQQQLLQQQHHDYRRHPQAQPQPQPQGDVPDLRPPPPPIIQSHHENGLLQQAPELQRQQLPQQHHVVQQQQVQVGQPTATTSPPKIPAVPNHDFQAPNGLQKTELEGSILSL